MPATTLDSLIERRVDESTLALPSADVTAAENPDPPSAAT
jgi:hypothetical protein